MTRTWLILSGALFSLGGCGGKNGAAAATSDERLQRDTKIVLEKCDAASKKARKLDVDGDGRAEVVKVMSGNKEKCRIADLNMDGKTDRTTFFDAAGKIRRIESDFDRDGRVDELAFLTGGLMKEKHRATTLTGRLDTWEFFEAGDIVRTERDENGDAFVDQWWEYPVRGCPLIHVDTDGDGRPNPGASVDYCKETGYTPPPPPMEKTDPSKAQFGTKDARVEELSNTKGDTAAPAEAPPAVSEPKTDVTPEAKP